MKIVFASVLAVLAASTPAWGQPHQGLTECGARPAMRYAAVFDASSSLRDEPALRAETEASYRKLLGLFAGLLCTGDRLAVYTFPPDSTTRMNPLVEITSSSRAPSLLSATARRVIDAHSGHTDFYLLTRGIARDLLAGNAADAIFVVTDGSYYPFSPSPDDRTLEGVRNRLTELATFVAHTMRGDTSRVFVIGVNAENSYAVDRQLSLTLPAASANRRWENVDLLEDHGEDLLKEVFGTRYIGLSEFSLWKVLLGPPRSVWARRLDYLTDKDLPWHEASTLSLQHLVYVPDGHGGSASCTPPTADGVPARIEEVRYSVAGGVLCSLSYPSPAQIAAIQEPPSHFAFSQRISLWPQGAMHLRGPNDLLLRDSAQECSGKGLRRDLGTTRTGGAGELRISKAGKIVWSDPIRLVRLPSTGCVVPHFTGGEWPSTAGEYFVKVAHEKTSVFRVTVEPARAQVVDAFIRPAGLPFPSDKIALVRVCVRTSPALPVHQRMWMRLENKLLPLTLERGSRCSGAAPDVAAFSGLVGLRHADPGTAEIFVVNEDDNPEGPHDGGWTTFALDRDGRLFLSWLHLFLGALSGMVLQLLYAWRANRESNADWLRRPSTWSGAVISGIIVAVVAQFAVAISETDFESDRIPVVLALSVLAHIVKLLAAALVPEYVEEFLLTD